MTFSTELIWLVSVCSCRARLMQERVMNPMLSEWMSAFTIKENLISTYNTLQFFF